MPFLGVDSWRWQYFENETCPADVTIPIDDATAWALYPDYRWIHNKLEICRTQGLPHGPHGTAPSAFPIFSKPIYNLRGMGAGSRPILDATSYEASLEPGHMWMPLFVGDHVSTDVALHDGQVCWMRHTTGVPARAGTFDHWTIHAEDLPDLGAYLRNWIGRNLAGFTGVVNFETIGGRIIECHLRMSEQWLDLNGKGWLAAVVGLYSGKGWRYADDERRTGYSVILFRDHGAHWSIDHGAVDRLRRAAGISSIQITFEDDRPPETHAMPPGGFRLAIVNCWDFEAGKRVRAELAALFGRA